MINTEIHVSVVELLWVCKTHTQECFSSFCQSSSGLNFVSFAAALSQRAGRDSATLCGECTTSERSGLQAYLVLARLHPEAFGICLKQQPRRLLENPVLQIMLQAELMNNRIFTT